MSWGGSKDNSFVIEGNIAGVRDSVTVVLFKIDDSIFKRLGTRGYSTFVLISPEGNITDIWCGYSEGSIRKSFLDNKPVNGTSLRQGKGMNQNVTYS